MALRIEFPCMKGFTNSIKKLLNFSLLKNKSRSIFWSGTPKIPILLPKRFLNLPLILVSEILTWEWLAFLGSSFLYFSAYAHALWWVLSVGFPTIWALKISIRLLWIKNLRVLLDDELVWILSITNFITMSSKVLTGQTKESPFEMQCLAVRSEGDHLLQI